MIEKVFQNEIQVDAGSGNLKGAIKAGTLQFFGRG